MIDVMMMNDVVIWVRVNRLVWIRQDGPMYGSRCGSGLCQDSSKSYEIIIFVGEIPYLTGSSPTIN